MKSIAKAESADFCELLAWASIIQDELIRGDALSGIAKHAPSIFLPKIWEAIE